MDAVHDDLTAFYEAGYTQQDPERAALLGRWRALGAQSKAAHVVELCRRPGSRPGGGGGGGGGGWGGRGGGAARCGVCAGPRGGRGATRASSSRRRRRRSLAI